MYLDAAKKQEIFEKYGKSNTDTGFPQIAFLFSKVGEIEKSHETRY